MINFIYLRIFAKYGIKKMLGNYKGEVQCYGSTAPWFVAPLCGMEPLRGWQVVPSNQVSFSIKKRRKRFESISCVVTGLSE